MTEFLDLHDASSASSPQVNETLATTRRERYRNNSPKR